MSEKSEKEEEKENELKNEITNSTNNAENNTAAAEEKNAEAENAEAENAGSGEALAGTKKKKAAAKKTAKASSKKSASKKAKKTLVIVESPHKAENIGNYLGSHYNVKASVGHVIDLPKSRMAIQIDNNFEPEYITVRGKAKLLKELQKDAKNSDMVLLASDPDREGEAIAWHLNNALKDKTEAPIKRVVFPEITPKGISEGIANPHDIDEAMVNAQKGRRVIDRLVGYNLSPLLWKKVKNGLSAGRVQSVALKMICEREDEVDNFIPEEYWSLDADFQKGKSVFACQLAKYKGKTPELKSEAEVQKIVEEIKNSKCTVTDIKSTEKTVRPKPAFTTSKMQQAAANRLGFNSRKTMQVAQQLYQGIQVGNTTVGLITYMRTDSVRIADSAIEDARSWIGKNYPDQLPAEPIRYSVGKGAQDAHEAIRPTYVSYTPDDMKEYLSRDQLRLYQLIWERFVSCQMTNAKTVTTTAEISAGDAVFRISSTKLSEKGFYSVIKLLSSKEEVTGSLPSLKVGETVDAKDFHPEQHFTHGPARYTDASIIELLDETGIGRPSTYHTIVGVLIDRYYITRSNKQLVPTQLGRMINKILVEAFPEVINEKFTAEVETKLDEVEQNNIVWNDMIRDFYGPFKKRVDEVEATTESMKGFLDEQTDKICEKCGKPMVKKLGRFGYFLACSGFPECHNTKSVPLAKCPREGCNGEIVARKTKGRGKEFYGCTNYPQCDFISHFKPIDVYCPKCHWFLVEKYDKKNGSYKSCINPDCDYLHSADEAVAAEAAGEFAAANEADKKSKE